MTIGSRAQVLHGNADRTSGGLVKSDLRKNKYEKIVSIKASKSAKKRFDTNPDLRMAFAEFKIAKKSRKSKTKKSRTGIHKKVSRK